GMERCLLQYLESSASVVMEHQVMKTAKAYGKDLAPNYNASHGSIASSHLNDSVTNLNDVLIRVFIHLSWLVTGILFTSPILVIVFCQLPLGSLHLNNVLITSHIVKNLIYVRQFVRDNNFTIEFDAFGFFVKDFMTRRVLLRCDSTGDLYPVTAPSPIPHAFLVIRGVDVDETFSPTDKSGTIWTVISLAASRHWLIHQLDVKNAFLHGDLSETVYMHHLMGF
ncbi:ribonuclease H-like domain-containing protein, partial [Tanacetum coccineum]